MFEYEVFAKRIDEHGRLAECKWAEFVIDTDGKGRADAFNAG